MKTLLLLCIAVPFLAAGCSKSTEPNDQISSPYMMLNVGDKRQYIDMSDSSTSVFEITGKTKRTDGQEVYIGQWSYGIYPPTDSSYYLIKDGYFISTNLNTSASKTNPFFEQKLAKLYPNDKETWIQMPDSDDTKYVYAEYKGQMEMPSKKFEKVFAFIFKPLNLHVYYAEGYGHIGSSIPDQKFEISSSYIRVNGFEHGKLLPAKNPKLTLSKTARSRISLFGEYSFALSILPFGSQGIKNK